MVVRTSVTIVKKLHQTWQIHSVLTKAYRSLKKFKKRVNMENSTVNTNLACYVMAVALVHSTTSSS